MSKTDILIARKLQNRAKHYLQEARSNDDLVSAKVARELSQIARELINDKYKFLNF